MATVVLSGGVGAARFLTGLVKVMDPRDITVISNTGDDSKFYGLYVCPDIDTVIYTLADMVNPQTGWGLVDDSFQALAELKALGCETWFQLGDRDFATHIWRTMLLRQGQTLSQVTQKLAQMRGLELTILPMSDHPVHTVLKTEMGRLAFQEYMVKHRFQVKVDSICFEGAEKALPAPGVLEAIAGARQIIIAPSNPYVSIGTILSVPGIRKALENATGKVAAISPIVGGDAIKGPAARLLSEFGQPVSPLGVAQLYQNFVDLMIVDERDRALLPEIRALGMEAASAQTMMTSPQAKVTLAKQVLELMK
jgi:LPPG:FO 2-phospho-L-lactate transferase